VFRKNWRGIGVGVGVGEVMLCCVILSLLLRSCREIHPGPRDRTKLRHRWPPGPLSPVPPFTSTLNLARLNRPLISWLHRIGLFVSKAHLRHFLISQI